MSAAASGTSRCLSEAEIEAVRAAPPGQAPAEPARHLAACERCQERVLSGGLQRRAPRREPPKMPSPTRALFLVALLLLALIGFLYTLRLMMGG